MGIELKMDRAGSSGFPQEAAHTDRQASAGRHLDGGYQQVEEISEDAYKQNNVYGTVSRPPQKREDRSSERRHRSGRSVRDLYDYLND